jgi:serine/threonine-protein kinase
VITPQAGVVVASKYTLERPLASGGMGSVWIARHRDLKHRVAVKFMAPALVASADARARFEREATVAAQLNSQHVVHALDYGLEDDTPYMVMELLHGESLWDRISREGQLPVPVAARLVIQICRALRTAHEAGLVHRDLKPGNIFLALKDDEEVVKILDFGIVKARGFGEAQAETKSDMLMGSVHYMSPEQIRSSRDVDPRSDLWSLGVILFRMLTGGLPFPGNVAGDVLVRVCTDPIPPLSKVAPDLPAWLEGFFARALARNPDERFQSAQELASAFSASALGTPSLPPSSTKPQPEVAAPLSPESGAGGAEQLANETVTQRMPWPAEPLPKTPTARLTAADIPTLAVVPLPETETAQSVVRESEAEAPRAAEPATFAGERVPVHSRWPLWAAALGIALAGILVMVLRSSAPRRDSAKPAAATVTTSAPTAAPAERAEEREEPPTASSLPGASSSASQPKAPARPRDRVAMPQNPFDDPAQAPGTAPKAPAGATSGRAAAPERPPAPRAKPTVQPVSGPMESKL